MKPNSTKESRITTLERAIVAAYSMGWRDRAAVGADVVAGRIEATESDLAAPAIDVAELLRRVGEEI